MNSQQLEQKFQRFFIANFPVVRNFALMLLKSESDADDVAQDVFLKLWNAPDIWDGKSEVDGYIYAMTRNIILNRFRHLEVEREYQNEVVSGSPLSELMENSNVLDDIYCREAEMLVELVLEKLPSRRKQIFELSRYQNLSNKEIAEKLGLSVRTVEHQIYLVLSELKRVIFLYFFFIFFK